MVFAVMSNTDTIGPEKCRAVIEEIMGAPVGNIRWIFINSTKYQLYNNNRENSIKNLNCAVLP